MREMHELERTIGYTFQNEGFLRTALTHSSYANETRAHCPYNERQEFLGDAVLSIIVSDYLFKSSHLAEGDLTKLRASIVCEKSLCGWAREIRLGDYILLGKGEENSGGRERPSILADAFEALIAAVYLDSGMERTREFLNQAEKEGQVIPCDDLPKSFILTAEYGFQKVYLTSLSSYTLEKRRRVAADDFPR